MAMNARSANIVNSPIRVVHLNFVADRSIEDKLRDQARAAREIGVPMDFVVMSATGTRLEEDNLFIRPIPGRRAGYRMAMKLHWPFRLFQAARAVDWSRYDIMILRYPKLPLGAGCLVRRFGRPVIAEHHTHELKEIRGGGSLPRGIAAMLESKLRKNLGRHVAGVIGVSEEIARAAVHAYAAGRAIPWRAISNGVCVDRIAFTGFNPFAGRELVLLFVAGHFAPWHGLDRLLNSLLRGRVPVDIRLILVGNLPDVYLPLVQACRSRPNIRIEIPGPVYGSDLDRYFREAHLAISSLGEYRIGVLSRPTLKVREYMARGIPFIYASHDPDLEQPCEYALRLANSDEDIDVNVVVDFARRVACNPRLSAEMRHIAETKLDWKCMVGEAYKFALEVHRSRQGSPIAA